MDHNRGRRRGSPRRHGGLVALAGLIGAVLAAGPANAGPATSARAEHYIVVLRDVAGDPSVVADEHAGDHGGRRRFVYRHAIRGYSMVMSEAAARRVGEDPRVQSVRRDGTVELAAQTPSRGIDRVYLPTTNQATYPNLTVDGVDDHRVDVDIAIIDGGIDHTHPDLHVVGGTDCSDANLAGECVDGLHGDYGFHGTHVAGIAAAIDNGIGVVGVAPGARLWDVRTVGGQDLTGVTSLLAAIDWVTARAATIEVANMSVACKACPEVLVALRNLAAAGVTAVASAGNDNLDAATQTPANSPDVITVSAIADIDGRSGGLAATFRCAGLSTDDVDDHKASFSNWGQAVDVAAPGVCIVSTVPASGSSSGYAQVSGTSQAAPHVAGAAALLASRGAPYKGNPTVIRDTIIAAGNSGWVDTSPDGISEPLLDVTSTTFVPQTVRTNRLPSASFNKSCHGAACTFTSTSTDPDGNGTITSWQWRFGDNTAGSGATVSHTYAAAGSYNVTLTVTDNAGASSSATRTVNCKAQKQKLVCA